MCPLLLKIIVCLLCFSGSSSISIHDVNLPLDHIKFYLNNFPKISKDCKEDDNCPYKTEVNTNRCWGYEENCKPSNSYSLPRCPVEQKWMKSKEEQLDTFYKQGDFGYVQEQRKEMTVMCEPTFPDDSALECSKHLRFCRGRNIFMNFTSLLERKELLRYKMDIFKDGDIGGHCKLYSDRLREECDHISPLQSWGPEFRFFKELKSSAKEVCDVVINKTIYIMKIDATVNMYHHFCDFFNLYASQHVNNIRPDVFSTDVHILIWESYTYYSNFGEMWEAFTSHPLWDLNTFKGKTVCFKDIIFPLLPRMIFGLYYNTPIVSGCKSSGLFHAFSHHILHRLKIPETPPEDKKLRITLLSRDTSYRNILNEQELLWSLKNNTDYNVKRVVYNRKMPFKKQLELTRNSDIFIGIHGAGLTHLLFLPDWAAVFELYNCEDENCYLDLARLRGLKYLTWPDKSTVYPQDEGHHPDGGAHAKFTNYRFDVNTFIKVIQKAESYVKSRKDYKEFLNKHLGHDEL